jgi:hypothetical protein
MTEHIKWSPWEDSIKTAIRAYSISRAKELIEGRTLPLPRNDEELEQFLTEVLIDALQTFNADFNEAYNVHPRHVQQLLDDYAKAALPAPIVIQRNG